ncbi:MAG: hypothetical protein Tsb0034_06180 [Ekhidna sp.]
MAKQKQYPLELENLRQYISSDLSEDSKRHMLYPIFKALFKDQMKIETDAKGADVYIEGQLIVESKSNYSQWLAGFYQALHYHKKFGLAYSTIMVIAKEFVGIWKVDSLPEYAVILSHTTDATLAPSKAGTENARKTNSQNKVDIHRTAQYWLEPKDLKLGIFDGGKSLITEVHAILQILNNLDSTRVQINPLNFIQCIERMKDFFSTPIEAIHAFYTIVAYWDITSVLTEQGEVPGTVSVTGFKGKKASPAIQINPRKVDDFRRFVETQFVFTNEGSGLTADYYFSRFDEVISVLNPEYAKQHGIFFTDDNLSKFALWYVQNVFKLDLSENYIVFDPAGGSGNLVSSWKGKLKHKIVSELQPDLLKTIQRRMEIDPFHQDTGFTIIPKTTDGVGLNFIDQSAGDYFERLEHDLALKNMTLDKPLAFLLNPPYKNTDENVSVREGTEAEYEINPDILELTGNDAGKERYLAFLGQILLMAKYQKEKYNIHPPLVLIFTPTSWLIPRPTYVDFRKKWDAHFKYESGFIITSNEFFKLKGKWPLAFTIWSYEPEEDRSNEVKLLDLTELKRADLNIGWNDEEVENKIEKVLNGKHKILFSNKREDIRNYLPKVFRGDDEIPQPRVNIYRNLTKDEEGLPIVSGFPLKDERHSKLSVPYGYSDGTFIGFMDDNTPVRLHQDTCNRMSNKPDRVWFQLRPTFIDINLTKVMPGPPDKYGYCAYDLPSAKTTFEWFCITKAFLGNYPLWANQFDIWKPTIPTAKEKEFYALCFTYVLAENRCVVTKFEADNPVPGAPEVFVDNPLCPTNPESFWSNTLAPEIIGEYATKLVKSITELYTFWNRTYTKGQVLEDVGLKDEAYFRYFDYPDFVTPYSGLIQIRKYAEVNAETELLEQFKEIQEYSKAVRGEIYRLLVEEFGYFE